MKFSAPDSRCRLIRFGHRVRTASGRTLRSVLREGKFGDFFVLSLMEENLPPGAFEDFVLAVM